MATTPISLSSEQRLALLLLLTLPAASLFAASPVPPPSAKNAPKTQRAPTESKLDLNTASQSALASIPAIGADGAHAIIAARPFTRIDDLNRLTGLSAERLEHIRAQVPVVPETIPIAAIKDVPSSTSPRNDAKTRTRVDINAASYETLAALPAIGTETAKAIVAARPFTHLDQLNRLKGLSAERLEQIRGHFIVGEPPRQKTKLNQAPTRKPDP